MQNGHMRKLLRQYLCWHGLAPILAFRGGVAQNYTAFEDIDAFFLLGGSGLLLDHRRTGGSVGGLLGYNWQTGSFVYGVEGDWNWIRSKWTRFDSDFDGTGHDSRSISFDASWLATLRGRVGLAFDSLLLYVTGGAALVEVSNSLGFDGQSRSGVASFTQKQSRIGWTAGVGAEYMITPHWTARAEFRYVDLGRAAVTCNSTFLGTCQVAGSSNAYRGTFSNTLKLGLVGLAYKF